ncbi:MAG: sugar kinase, partial [Burkholderiales bacterium]|nr:sugar kinase [Anaerolineae bacterium]
LCALMDGKSLEDALRYGNAVAALKMTMPGDLALVTHDEVERLMSQPTEGIVR